MNRLYRSNRSNSLISGIIAASLGISMLGCSSTSESAHKNPYSDRPDLSITSNLISDIRTTAKKEKRSISYKLDDLCDTNLDEKNITLNVYIEPSEKIWDYHDHKKELLGYVSDFFRKQNIICNIQYDLSPSERSNNPDEFCIEIYSSNDSLTKRYLQLFPPENDKKRKELQKKTSNMQGYSAGKKGIALVNGAWEEFRDCMTKKEVKEQFSEIDDDTGLTIKEYHLRQNAGLIAHEVLHCMGLFHPNTFFPPVIKTHHKNIANIMSYFPPRFTKEHPEGFILEPLQKKLIHSYISGNNSYKAFSDSGKDLETYLKNLTKSNHFYLREEFFKRD